jgi:short-subunit dehydrogenase
MSEFDGQVAVVTGASSGIGKTVACSLAQHGATVCLVARRLEELQTVAASFRGNPVPQTYQTDLSVDEEVKRLVTRLRADFDHIDILVHSAAVYARGRFACAPISDLEKQFRTNVFAPYLLTQALLPVIPPNRGQIVFVNSNAGLTAPESLSQYAASKHALKGIADSLRNEVNKDGIRVLSIFLGRTATPLQAAVHAMEDKIYHPEQLMQAQDVAAVILNALSLPRTAEVTEIMMRSMKRPTT